MIGYTHPWLLTCNTGGPNLPKSDVTTSPTRIMKSLKNTSSNMPALTSDLLIHTFTFHIRLDWRFVPRHTLRSTSSITLVATRRTGNSSATARHSVPTFVASWLGKKALYLSILYHESSMPIVRTCSFTILSCMNQKRPRNSNLSNNNSKWRILSATRWIAFNIPTSCKNNNTR